jgi:hypothetical protein
MFLRSYFECGCSNDAAGIAPGWLILTLTLYLTDFQESIFAGRDPKNRAFCPVRNRKPPPFTISILTILWINGNLAHLHPL